MWRKGIKTKHHSDTNFFQILKKLCGGVSKISIRIMFGTISLFSLIMH